MTEVRGRFQRIPQPQARLAWRWAQKGEFESLPTWPAEGLWVRGGEASEASHREGLQGAVSPEAHSFVPVPPCPRDRAPHAGSQHRRGSSPAHHF